MLTTDPWPVRWTCAEVDTQSPAATGIAALAATQILDGLSGNQFGLTSHVLRPCRRACLPTGWTLEPWGGWGYPYPTLDAGVFVNLGCGSCHGDCACATLQEAELPGQVYDVTEVKVDGVVVSGSGWRLDRHPKVAGTLLVRIDGGAWPTCQNLTLADGAGTWLVTARYGQPVPEIASLAVGELACEFLKGMDGQDCRLPREVVSLARQGVTLQFPDAVALARDGFLGLVMCDRFLQAVNPLRRQRKVRVVSPDRPGIRRVGV
jgi:hypothetical protein